MTDGVEDGEYDGVSLVEIVNKSVMQDNSFFLTAPFGRVYT